MRSPLPDFDTLMEIAQKDPDALEEFRRNAVEAIILAAPKASHQRLRGLQFQIDSQRQLHSSPMGCCLKLSEMMHDSFNHLHSLLAQLAKTDGKHPPPLPLRLTHAPDKSGKTPSAQVLPFPKH